jgi:hypothetical protein
MLDHGRARKRVRQGKHGSTADDSLVWGSEQYPQIQPGEYELYCTEAKVYFDPGLKVHKCRYRFIKPMDDDFPPVYGFIHIGEQLKTPGRRSRYFREWSIANGDAPGKRQVMSPRIFQSKFFLVRVGWVLARQHDGKEHTSETRYSLVREIKRRVGP